MSNTVDGQATDYVIDANNHTGYAQVLEEHDAATGDVKKSFTIGHDVYVQWDETNGTVTLLTDGHGSTRFTVDAAGGVVQRYDYDAYGNLLNSAFTPITDLLYSGEFFDATTGLQYLRARYFSPNTGRFNRLDPFVGRKRDPQSLHKYLYCHAGPIMGIDPSGQYLGVTSLILVSLISIVVLGLVASHIVGGMHMIDPPPVVQFDDLLSFPATVEAPYYVELIRRGERTDVFEGGHSILQMRTPHGLVVAEFQPVAWQVLPGIGYVQLTTYRPGSRPNNERDFPDVWSAMEFDAKSVICIYEELVEMARSPHYYYVPLFRDCHSFWLNQMSYWNVKYRPLSYQHPRYRNL